MSSYVATAMLNSTGLGHLKGVYKTPQVRQDVAKEKNPSVNSFNKALGAALVIAGALNVGSLTSSPSFEIKPVVINVEKNSIEENSLPETAIEKSNFLQKLYGFNTSQWASLLKVERKTIYNWNNNKTTKIKSSALERLKIFEEFSVDFKPDHSLYFKKIIFGKMVNEDVRAVFFEEPLVLEKITDAYFDVFAQLEGFTVRSKMA